jgi:hypothetical protein
MRYGYRLIIGLLTASLNRTLFAQTSAACLPSPTPL